MTYVVDLTQQYLASGISCWCEGEGLTLIELSRSAQRRLVEEEDKFRRLFAEDASSRELQDPHVLLEDVFSLGPHQWTFQDEDAEEVLRHKSDHNQSDQPTPPRPILFDSIRLIAKALHENRKRCPSCWNRTASRWRTGGPSWTVRTSS